MYYLSTLYNVPKKNDLLGWRGGEGGEWGEREMGVAEEGGQIY